MFRTGEEFTYDYQAGGTYIDAKAEINLIATILFNFWYDIPVSSTVKPYFGLSTGIGIVSYDLDLDMGFYWYSKSGTASAFIIGPGAGIRFDVTEDIAVDAQVRYLFSTDYDIDGEDYAAPMLDFSFGMAYKF